MKRTALAIFCVALAACEGQNATAPFDTASSALNSSAGVALDQQFELRVGQTATIAGEGLTVEFQAVPEDSRCPTGVQCVWAGNARVQVVLAKGGKAAGVELNTNLEPKSADYLEYNIELVSLAPYPTAKNPSIPQSQYRATFVVRKQAVLGSPFSVKVGGSKTVQGEGLTVRFDTVLTDSRCPSDVSCVWAGDAEVQVTLSKPGFAPLTTVLHTTLTPQSVAYNGYTVTLNGLAPYPVSTSTINPASYVATFTVTQP